MNLERQNFALFLLIGAGLLGAAAWQVAETRSFVRSAVRTEGRFIQYPHDEGRRIPFVAFRTRDGQEITFQPGGTARGAIGETVTVLYPEDLPGKARLGSYGALWFGAWGLGIIGASFVIISALGLRDHPARRRAARRRRREELRLAGVRVMSTLARVERGGGFGGKWMGPWRIVSTFRDPASGRVQEFRSPYLTTDPTPRLASTSIPVLVDRNDPRRYLMELAPLLRKGTRAPRREAMEPPDATPASAARDRESPRPAAFAPPPRPAGFLSADSKVAGVGIGAIFLAFGVGLAALTANLLSQPRAGGRALALLPFALGFGVLGVLIVVRTLRDRD